MLTVCCRLFAEVPRSHLLICLKNALPRISRPHVVQCLLTRACLRKGAKLRDIDSPAVRTQSIEL
jgi:hypothetical protein